MARPVPSPVPFEALTRSIIPSVANATLCAQIIAVTATTPSTLEVFVAILKGIDNASRNGNADFGLHVTVTYVSNNSTVETVDSGRVSIRDGTARIPTTRRMI